MAAVVSPSELLSLVVEAAARGAIGGGRHVVAAAVAAAIRTGRRELLDMPTASTKQEVEARLDMARPALTTLVAAGPEQQQCLSGAQRAARNFALHAEMGCGAAGLPLTAGEAKRRGRGRRRTAAESRDEQKLDAGQLPDETKLVMMGKADVEVTSANKNHPDKLYDQVPDAALDTSLDGNPQYNVACEKAMKDTGEITTKIGSDSYVADLPSDDSKGQSDKAYEVLVPTNKQSPDKTANTPVSEVKAESSDDEGNRCMFCGHCSLSVKCSTGCDAEGKAGFKVRQADLLITGLEREAELQPLQDGDMVKAVNAAFPVGTKVRGSFGVGEVTYVVPPGASTAGWVEVDGDGHCDIYPPEELQPA